MVWNPAPDERPVNIFNPIEWNSPMTATTVTSGVPDLDRLLEGGIFIGDNVVWYDDAGMLAMAFCLNLLRASVEEKKSLIYVSFDRSPKNLLERFGALANNRYLTILDCFTYGKGEASSVFLDFYRRKRGDAACRIVCVSEPQNPETVAGTFYDLHGAMRGDVRFVFESLTGMQDLWGGEESIMKFYAHACPRLYELNTIAYWIVEKEVHSRRLKALLNQVTQVAVDLSLKRGKTYLSLLKAEKRSIDILNQPAVYWSKGLSVTFDPARIHSGPLDLGRRIKELRAKKGMSQVELARQIGVTPSTISQVENNQIFPSIPALIKMSEILSVDAGYFFQASPGSPRKIVFPEFEATPAPVPGMPRRLISCRRLMPEDMEMPCVPYIIEIQAGAVLPGHFFSHKGVEMGYLLEGELFMTLEPGEQAVQAGDLIYLSSDTPLQWENRGKLPAKMIWVTAMQ